MSLGARSTKAALAGARDALAVRKALTSLAKLIGLTLRKKLNTSFRFHDSTGHDRHGSGPPQET
jgi:hypothetical protein